MAHFTVVRNGGVPTNHVLSSSELDLINKERAAVRDLQRRAAQTVLRLAHDADDARLLLEALDLDPALLKEETPS